MVRESLVDLTGAKKLRDARRFKEAMKEALKIEKDLEKKWESGEIEEISYYLEVLGIENFKISVLFRILIDQNKKGGG